MKIARWREKVTRSFFSDTSWALSQAYYHHGRLSEMTARQRQRRREQISEVLHTIGLTQWHNHHDLSYFLTEVMTEMSALQLEVNRKRSPWWFIRNMSDWLGDRQLLNTYQWVLRQLHRQWEYKHGG